MNFRRLHLNEAEQMSFTMTHRLYWSRELVLKNDEKSFQDIDFLPFSRNLEVESSQNRIMEVFLLFLWTFFFLNSRLKMQETSGFCCISSFPDSKCHDKKLCLHYPRCVNVHSRVRMNVKKSFLCALGFRSKYAQLIRGRSFTLLIRRPTLVFLRRLAARENRFSASTRVPAVSSFRLSLARHRMCALQLFSLCNFETLSHRRMQRMNFDVALLNKNWTKICMCFMRCICTAKLFVRFDGVCTKTQRILRYRRIQFSWNKHTNGNDRIAKGRNDRMIQNFLQSCIFATRERSQLRWLSFSLCVSFGFVSVGFALHFVCMVDSEHYRARLGLRMQFPKWKQFHRYFDKSAEAQATAEKKTAAPRA